MVDMYLKSVCISKIIHNPLFLSSMIQSFAYLFVSSPLFGHDYAIIRMYMIFHPGLYPHRIAILI